MFKALTYKSAKSFYFLTVTLLLLLVASIDIKQAYAFSVTISPTSAYITMDESVTFTSTVSGGTPPYIYQWYLNCGLAEWDGSIAVFTPAQDGYYIIYLEVTDALNITVRSNNATVVVYPPIPDAEFTYFPTYPQPNEVVTFNASASTPGADAVTIESYYWDFGDGETASGKIVLHSYATEGFYTVTLNVTNCLGYWDVESKLIRVIKPHGPIANFTESPKWPHVGEVVKFDASSSIPGWNGTHVIPIVEYRWDFGDGNKTTVQDPVIYHVFDEAGVYYVNLTVYAPGANPETNSFVHWKVVTSPVVGGYTVGLEKDLSHNISPTYSGKISGFEVFAFSLLFALLFLALVKNFKWETEREDLASKNT